FAISLEGFLPSILLLVVIIVTVVIVAVILAVVVVAIVGVVVLVGVSAIIKLLFVIIGSSGAGSLPSGCVDLTGDENPTDEDGDIEIGDSTEVSVSFGDENLLEKD
ncbi:hypothetical protein Tco_0981384, partial [Tanacetum coccineum]